MIWMAPSNNWRQNDKKCTKEGTLGKRSRGSGAHDHKHMLNDDDCVWSSFRRSGKGLPAYGMPSLQSWDVWECERFHLPAEGGASKGRCAEVVDCSFSNLFTRRRRQIYASILGLKSSLSILSKFCLPHSRKCPQRPPVFRDGDGRITGDDVARFFTMSKLSGSELKTG